jgi:hypothetical protein
VSELLLDGNPFMRRGERGELHHHLVDQMMDPGCVLRPTQDNRLPCWWGLGCVCLGLVWRIFFRRGSKTRTRGDGGMAREWATCDDRCGGLVEVWRRNSFKIEIRLLFLLVGALKDRVGGVASGGRIQGMRWSLWFR